MSQSSLPKLSQRPAEYRNMQKQLAALPEEEWNDWLERTEKQCDVWRQDAETNQERHSRLMAAVEAMDGEVALVIALRRALQSPADSP